MTFLARLTKAGKKWHRAHEEGEIIRLDCPITVGIEPQEVDTGIIASIPVPDRCKRCCPVSRETEQIKRSAFK